MLGRVIRTMSIALLLRNNPKRKKSNFRSPAPPPLMIGCSRLTWGSSSTSLLLISPGTLYVQLTLLVTAFILLSNRLSCAHVACDSEWLYLCVCLCMCVCACVCVCIYYYPPKWCTDCTIWLLHGWCYVKLQLSRYKFCVHHTTMHQFTASFHSKPYRSGACVSLAVTCHLNFWQNDQDLLRATAVTQGWNGYQNKSQHIKLTMRRKFSRHDYQTQDLSITWWVRRHNRWAIPALLTLDGEPSPITSISKQCFFYFIFSNDPLNVLQPNLAWWFIIMSSNVVENIFLLS